VAGGPWPELEPDRPLRSDRAGERRARRRRVGTRCWWGAPARQCPRPRCSHLSALAPTTTTRAMYRSC